MKKSLDCGHRPSRHGPHTTGTARTSAGREICWSCATVAERRALRTADHYTAYLTRDRNGHAVLSTWPGRKLARVTWHVARAVGFGWRPSRIYFKARDIHGGEWHGSSPGFGMYARMHRRHAAVEVSP